MSFQEAIKLKDPETFSFPAIYDGLAVKVTVAREKEDFLVLIDDVPTATVKLNEGDYSWHVIKGYLSDDDLVQEVGHRIEARQKNFSY